VGIEGEPFPASVSIAGDAGVLATTTADDDGKFSFRELPAGAFVVRATISGWRPAEHPLTLPPNADGIRLRLRTPEP
jgi:hypothetical protein